MTKILNGKKMHKRNLRRRCIFFFFLIRRFRIDTVGIFYDHKNAFMEYTRTCEAIVINYANNQLFVYKKWIRNYRTYMYNGVRSYYTRYVNFWFIVEKKLARNYMSKQYYYVFLETLQRSNILQYSAVQAE